MLFFIVATLFFHVTVVLCFRFILLSPLYFFSRRFTVFFSLMLYFVVIVLFFLATLVFCHCFSFTHCFVTETATKNTKRPDMAYLGFRIKLFND